MGYSEKTKDLLEKMKEEQYQLARKLQDEDNLVSLDEAIKIYSSNPSYKDSKFREEKCEQRIKEIKEPKKKQKPVSVKESKKKSSINLEMMIIGFLVYGIITVIVAFLVGFALSFGLAFISLGGMLFDLGHTTSMFEVLALIIGCIGAIYGAIKGANSKADSFGKFWKERK